ncbi:unnamed protein product [Calicophoron daubneyi]|uniref:Acyltransferase n=1 Tax=Calicophoron daubneyi TaxID=300641 RepID=A0AAV2TB62_CALDB
MKSNGRSNTQQVQSPGKQETSESTGQLPRGTIIVQSGISNPNGSKLQFQRCASYIATFSVTFLHLTVILITYWYFWSSIYLAFRFLVTSLIRSESSTVNLWEYFANHEKILFFASIYSIYYYLDWGVEDMGGHQFKFVRNLFVWKYLAHYFPIRMVLSDELVDYSKQHAKQLNRTDEDTFYGLPSDRTYLLGFHPHGLLSFGASVNFLTEANHISQTFPRIKPWVATLGAQFKFPILREFMLFIGTISASRKGLFYLLDPDNENNKGNLVVVVVGGAPEVLNAHPGNYTLTIRRRYGFFKLAMQTGASLIPCISFGEPGVYDQISNPPGSVLRRMQNFFMDSNYFLCPSIYPIAWGPFPRPRPINTVINLLDECQLSSGDLLWNPVQCTANHLRSSLVRCISFGEPGIFVQVWNPPGSKLRRLQEFVTAPIPGEHIPNPTSVQVEEIKQLYLERLEGLFERYKDVFDPETSEMVFI